MPSNSEKLNIDKTMFKTVSYSQYSLYNQCQHRWYLDYAQKLKTPSYTIDLTFGTSFHEVFQSYLETLYSKSEKEANKIDFRVELSSRMIENYSKSLEEIGGKHYTTKEMFHEYINDGVEILEWIRKKRSAYFRLREFSLVGIETPIQSVITPEMPNVLMIGFIDLILKNEKTGKYYVIDIKTSRYGWKDKEKKDQVKVNQVLLYKKFYSEALNVPQDMVEVSFFIVRKKLYENLEFPMKRVQEFIPAQGTVKVKSAYEDLAKFVKTVFTPEGEYVQAKYDKNFESCKFCPYNKNSELCPKK